MLIDKLNVIGEENQLFPFDLKFPLVLFEKFGQVFVGSIVDYGDGYWMLSPYLYRDVNGVGKYAACSQSFRINPGDLIEKLSDSDEIRLSVMTADLNVGLISGIPFSFKTRIH